MEPAVENLGKMEGSLFWHEQLTYVNGTSILRRINKYLDGDATEEKKALADETGNLVISMMYSLADRGSGDYMDILKRGREAIIDIANAGLVQTTTEETKPDLDVMEFASHIGLMGMRLAEAKFDLWNEKDGKPVFPADLTKFVTLDDVYSAYKQGAKEQNVRFDGKAFLNTWQGQINKFVMEPEKTGDIIAATRFNTQRYFSNEAAQIATDALDHFRHGYTTESDTERGELYRRGAEVVKMIKDTLVSDDPIYSSKRLFDAETYRFIGKVATPEERQSVELSIGMPLDSLLDELGPSENDYVWELDKILGKFKAYDSALKAADKLVYDIISHEMVGSESDSKPDMYLLSNIEQLKNVVIGIEKVAPGINNSIAALTNVFGEKMAEAIAYQQPSPEILDRLEVCRKAKEDVVKSLTESLVLYSTCNGVLQFYGKRADDAVVLETRIGRDVFDGIMGIVREGGSDMVQKVERYVAGRRGA